MHYRGTLDDGEQFDSSYDRGEPVTFQVGSGTMIPGFNDDGVIGMKVGETKKVEIKPADGYGDHNPAGVQEVTKRIFLMILNLKPVKLFKELFRMASHLWQLSWRKRTTQ